MKRAFLLVLVSVLAVSVGVGQNDEKSKSGTKTEKAEIDRIRKSYSVCSFEDGLRISEVERVQKGGLKYLARPTGKGFIERGTPKGKSPDRYFVRDDGVLYEGVTRTDAVRVMVDYKKPNYFANIRVDRSDLAGYIEDKEILIRWVSFLHAERPDSETKFPEKSYYNGFEAYSTFRKDVDVEKDELGITILFDEKNKISVTIYLLNPLPKYRVHKTTEEWRQLRERFLKRYTACIKENSDSIESQ